MSSSVVRLPTPEGPGWVSVAPRLTLPVLAIGGAEGIGEEAACDAQSVVIPGCGHYCLEEAQEMLTAFLAPYRESI
jgi:pimeloyl-ACP methyl ester carboxylesterase